MHSAPSPLRMRPNDIGASIMSPLAKRLLTLLLLTALTGCVSEEEQRAADQNRCWRYGYRFATYEFAACMERADTNRAIETRESFRDMNRNMQWQQDRWDEQRRWKEFMSRSKN